MKQQFYFFMIVAAVLNGCSATKPYYGKGEKNWEEKKLPEVPVRYTVYLLGDPGDDASGEAVNLLKTAIPNGDTSHATVIFGKAVKEKSVGKEPLSSPLIDHLHNDKGKILFIPDPDKEMSKAIEIRSALEKALGRKNIFIPEPGCLNAEGLDLSKEVMALPVHAILQEDEKIRYKRACEIDDHDELIDELKDIVDNNQRKNILMLEYYPMLNLGNHAGHFSLKQHLFPLTDWKKSLYVPLPVIGTVYYLLRAGIGFKSDLAYPPYKRFRRKMAKALNGYENIVFASGLEHNFQYFNYNKQDFIITNSSKDKSWTMKFNRAGMVYPASGLVRLKYFENGEAWMEIVEADGSEAGKIIFRKQLKDNKYKAPDTSKLITSSAELKDSIVFLAADERLQAGSFKTFFLGKHYREAWSAPVRIPVLDLRTEKGGLQIIKKGGGFQTKSLQLKNKKGEEYSLRSVSKYPERLLGNAMVNTLAADVVKDQVSSTHPYSPYVVDDLSEAAGVLHSNPKMVFVPNDSLLAEYKKDFANTLALFEQRADGNTRRVQDFGNPAETVSSKKMLEKIHEDNAYAVDDLRFLRSRLFDMWINDWDRHEGQWRWGEIACDSAHAQSCSTLKARASYFIPIPKDRDQAFSRFDGVIPWLAGRKWAVRKFQDFKNDIRDVPGLNFNARNIDHALLTELSRADWLRIAKDLQSDLTDEKIEHAIRQLPDTIYKIDGAFITERLKSRRDKLPSIAMRYYDYLAKNVDVVGSDKKENIRITRINDDSTSVEITNGESGNNELVYKRTFITGETKEIRIYGMDGDDKIEIEGSVHKAILLRIIGGKGNDSITDRSHVSGWSKRTKVYDTKNENSFALGKEGKDLRSDSKSVNEYDFYANDYNVVAPATYFGYNRDDGVFVGGGIMIRSNSFRKSPYANYQRIVANAAITNLSFSFRYTGDFNNIVGKWGLNVDASVVAPNGITNFFGYGNNTERLDIADNYYRFRYDQAYVFPALKKHMGKFHSIKIGPVYEYVKPRNESNRFITAEGAAYLDNFKSHHYTGGKIEYEYMHIDDSVLTFRGIKWLVSATSRYDIQNQTGESTTLESQLSFYIPVGNRSTIAVRGGGSHVLGDFAVYHASTLGGQNIQREPGNLRGFLRDRYSGRSAAFVNTDLRIKLFSFRTYLFPAHFGILGFYDSGRVWADDEESATWHHGYGGGVWLDPFGRAVINVTYALSEEENLLSVGIGFLF